MSFDLAITGGKVVSGGKAVLRDIFVSGGRIAAVRPPSKTAAARRVVDARGLTVLPGVMTSALAALRIRNWYGVE